MVEKKFEQIIHTVLPSMTPEEIEVFSIIPSLENILTKTMPNHRDSSYKKRYIRMLEETKLRICKKAKEYENKTIFKNPYTKEEFTFIVYDDAPDHVIVDTENEKLYTLSLKEIEADYVNTSTEENTITESKFSVGDIVKLSETVEKEWQTYPHWNRGYVLGKFMVTEDEVFLRVKVMLRNGYYVIYCLPEHILEKVR